ncbi:multidrug effflux MFS transporter [Neorhizobium sp. NCHU2750]|uniref:multidrug effflux MFS transporter n=1 Tax=Neorhizobium sp. NCHU2750 TaxID=1825976 RepID=UPI000E738206|nr:drug resistance transporter, Bcr/CflA family [Neorhizobium sp. NCHU2750]
MSSEMSSDTRIASLEAAGSMPAASSARWHVLAILSALMGFASISTDFYLPAMPAMAEALRADTGSVEFTISGYLVGFGIGQLFWGAVSDKYGRRLPVAIGLVLFILGSAGCAISGSISAIIAWRMLQAFGACASVVLARAMVRDLYHGPRAAQMLSTLIAIMAIAPLLAPLIGGQIDAIAGWRAIFWTLVVVGLATLAALFSLPETLPRERRNEAPLIGAFRRYALLFRHRKILGYAGAGAFFYSGVYAYIAGTPFAFITYHHVPAAWYGLLFGASILGIVAANMVNTRIVHRVSIDRILLAGTVAAAASGLMAALAAGLDLGGLWGLFIPLFVFVSMSGFIVANSIAGALADFPEQAGAVSALVGAIQYGSGVVGSALVGSFADGTPWPLGWVMSLMGIGSAICAWLVTSHSPRSIK